MDKLKLRCYWGRREELEEILVGSERLRSEAKRPVSQTTEGFPEFNTQLLSFSKIRKSSSSTLPQDLPSTKLNTMNFNLSFPYSNSLIR